MTNCKSKREKYPTLSWFQSCIPRIIKILLPHPMKAHLSNRFYTSVQTCAKINGECSQNGAACIHKMLTFINDAWHTAVPANHEHLHEHNTHQLSHKWTACHTTLAPSPQQTIQHKYATKVCIGRPCKKKKAPQRQLQCTISPAVCQAAPAAPS